MDEADGHNKKQQRQVNKLFLPHRRGTILAGETRPVAELRRDRDEISPTLGIFRLGRTHTAEMMEHGISLQAHGVPSLTWGGSIFVS